MPGTNTKVLIVGGGLAGLVLAILLERGGIDYLILEQSVLIRPYGSIIVISSLVLPLMEQLGVLEEIERASLPFGGITLLRGDQSVVGKIICDGRNGGLDYKQR
jgi:2-polyprenyl-6-methoxyphenol hydroxylase-like FAD-dependent oxidoreductase